MGFHEITAWVFRHKCVVIFIIRRGRATRPTSVNAEDRLMLTRSVFATHDQPSMNSSYVHNTNLHVHAGFSVAGLRCGVCKSYGRKMKTLTVKFTCLPLLLLLLLSLWFDGCLSTSTGAGESDPSVVIQSVTYIMSFNNSGESISIRYTHMSRASPLLFLLVIVTL